ncbi:hypothetical protein BC830DRAFT_1174769 [Chytriomyces sp. MP71]|nr:hypothetical protein BC830DRAFT_1174769 [Chytriomyces sp. MP71]
MSGRPPGTVVQGAGTGAGSGIGSGTGSGASADDRLILDVLSSLVSDAAIGIGASAGAAVDVASVMRRMGGMDEIGAVQGDKADGGSVGGGEAGWHNPHNHPHIPHQQESVNASANAIASARASTTGMALLQPRISLPPQSQSHSHSQPHTYAYPPASPTSTKASPSVAVRGTAQATPLSSTIQASTAPFQQHQMLQQPPPLHAPARKRGAGGVAAAKAALAKSVSAASLVSSSTTDSKASNSGGRKRPVVYAEKACSNCKISHVACDSGRPCQRCIRLNKSETCADAERKKRGRPTASSKDPLMGAISLFNAMPASPPPLAPLPPPFVHLPPPMSAPVTCGLDILPNALGLPPPAIPALSANTNGRTIPTGVEAGHPNSLTIEGGITGGLATASQAASPLSAASSAKQLHNHPLHSAVHSSACNTVDSMIFGGLASPNVPPTHSPAEAAAAALAAASEGQYTPSSGRHYPHSNRLSASAPPPPPPLPSAPSNGTKKSVIVPMNPIKALIVSHIGAKQYNLPRTASSSSSLQPQHAAAATGGAFQITSASSSQHQVHFQLSSPIRPQITISTSVSPLQTGVSTPSDTSPSAPPLQKQQQQQAQHLHARTPQPPQEVKRKRAPATKKRKAEDPAADAASAVPTEVAASNTAPRKIRKRAAPSVPVVSAVFGSGSAFPPALPMAMQVRAPGEIEEVLEQAGSHLSMATPSFGVGMGGGVRSAGGASVSGDPVGSTTAASAAVAAAAAISAVLEETAGTGMHATQQDARGPLQHGQGAGAVSSEDAVEDDTGLSDILQQLIRGILSTDANGGGVSGDCGPAALNSCLDGTNGDVSHIGSGSVHLIGSGAGRINGGQAFARSMGAGRVSVNDTVGGGGSGQSESHSLQDDVMQAVSALSMLLPDDLAKALTCSAAGIESDAVSASIEAAAKALVSTLLENGTAEAEETPTDADPNATSVSHQSLNQQKHDPRTAQKSPAVQHRQKGTSAGKGRSKLVAAAGVVVTSSSSQIKAVSPFGGVSASDVAVAGGVEALGGDGGGVLSLDDFDSMFDESSFQF